MKKSSQKRNSTSKATTIRAQLAVVPGFKFLDEVDTELKKVTWPTRKQALRLSAIVIAVSVFIGIFLGALDVVFVELVGVLLDLQIQ